MLVELALRREAGDGGRWAGAVGEAAGGEDACAGRGGGRGGRACGGAGDGQRGERVAEREQAEPCEARVAGDGGGRAAGPEGEEVAVVVVDEEEAGEGEDGGFEEGPWEGVHCEEEEEGED